MNRETFCLDLIRDMTGTLQDTLGLENAEGYVTIVGQMMGERIYHQSGYSSANPLPESELGPVLVDLKAQINGDFSVEQSDEDKICFVNKRCPFGDSVIGRPSLCMMTSNVFGFIASESKGYAKVEIEKSIASGDGFCRVIVHFEKNDRPGREYYKIED